MSYHLGGVSHFSGILLLSGFPAPFSYLFSDAYHRGQGNLIIALIKLVVPVPILVHM